MGRQMTCLRRGSQQFAPEHPGRCLPQTLLPRLLGHSAVDLHHHIHMNMNILSPAEQKALPQSCYESCAHRRCLPVISNHSLINTCHGF